MPYINDKKWGKLADDITSNKDVKKSLFAATVAGANAKRQGKSASEAAKDSLIVGVATKLLSAAFRALTKK